MGGFSPDLFKRHRLNTTARGGMSGASSEGGRPGVARQTERTGLALEGGTAKSQTGI